MKILLKACIALFFLAAINQGTAQAQSSNQEPIQYWIAWLGLPSSSGSSGAAAVSGSGTSLSGVMNSFFPPTVDSGAAMSQLQQMATNMVTKSTTTAQNIAKNVLLIEAQGCLKILITFILTAEVVFTGVRIMMRTPVAEQMARLVVITFIFSIVSSGKPQAIIEKGMMDLKAAGQKVGQSIITTAGSSSSSSGYKFSIDNLMKRIWNDNAWQNKMKQFQSQVGQDPTSPPAPGSLETIYRGMMLATAPFQILGMAVTVASLQTGAVVMVVFTTVSVLVGSIFTFYMALSFGMALLPLMYFKSFEKIWAQYLIGLAALGLVPCFFYIYSAIGFVFSTQLFDLMFPDPGAGGSSSGSMALILSGVYSCGFYQVLNVLSTLMGDALTVLSKLAAILLYAFILSGRIIFASSIVASFVFGGTMFSTLAVNSAFKWNQGFASEEMLSKISEFFTGVQGAVGTGLGQVYSEGANRVMGLVGGGGNGMTQQQKG